MMKKIFILSMLISLPFFAVADEAERRVMERLRVDIAELKGPPDVKVVIERQEQAAEDLLLVINSGRYEGRKLNYLKKVHSRMVLKPKTTQEEVNRTHTAMIERMRNNHENNFKNNLHKNSGGGAVNLRDNHNMMRERRQSSGSKNN